MRATMLALAIAATGAALGCGRARPAEAYKGPVRVQIKNACGAALTQAMLMPVGSQDARPWLENIANGSTAEAFVRADRYDLWFVLNFPDSSSAVAAGGMLNVSLTSPITIVVEQEGMRNATARPPDAIVVSLKSIAKKGN